MESIFQDLRLRMQCECSPRSSDNLTLKDCGKFVIRLSGSQSLTQKEIRQIVLMMNTEKAKEDKNIF